MIVDLHINVADFEPTTNPKLVTACTVRP